MPFESMIVVAVIVAVFTGFAGILAWGERQTRLAQPAPAGPRKRRAF